MDFFTSNDWLNRGLSSYAFQWDHLLFIALIIVIGVFLSLFLKNKSKKTIKTYSNNTIYINWHYSSEYGDNDSGSEEIPIKNASEENIKNKVEEFCNREWPEAGGYCDGVYVEVFVDLVPESDPTFLFDGRFEYGEVDWYKNNGKEHKYIPGGGCYVESRKMKWLPIK